MHPFFDARHPSCAVDLDSEEPRTPTKAIGEEVSLRTSEEGSNNGDDGSTKRRAAFHLAFGRGLLDESRAASMTRRGAVGWPISTHQRSLEDALNQLAQVFRECKREKANDELVEMAMKELDKMHAKMPEYLRIPGGQRFSGDSRNRRETWRIGWSSDRRWRKTYRKGSCVGLNPCLNRSMRAIRP